MRLLELRGVWVRDPHGIPLVSDATLGVDRGQLLHLVGESGSGKSLTLKAIIGLLPPGFTTGGEILLEGKSFLKERIRGRRITMVFQDPVSTMDPLYTVGFQIAEILRYTRALSGSRARAEARRLMELVGLEPGVLDALSGDLSGGMAQRVAIAMALAPGPEVILFDEPTTALDPTVEARILAVIRSVVNELGVAAVVVTHDLTVVDRMGGEVSVMYAGMVMETGPVSQVLSSPRHPYTEALMNASPFSGVVSSIPGDVLPPRARSGCPFHNRCAQATPECSHTVPGWRRDGAVAWRCHH